MASETMTLRLPALHPGQVRVANSRARTVVVSCGRRWGKTLVALSLAIHAAANGLRVLWLAPFVKNLRAAFSTARTMLERHGIATFVQAPDHDMRIGRGHVHFRSAESNAGLRGEGYDLVIADEAAFIPERVWTEVVQPMRLDNPTSRALVFSTPQVGVWFERWFRRAQECTDGSMEAITASSYENPHLSKQAIDELRADLSPAGAERELMARFVADAGTLFHELKIEPQPTGEMETVVLGVDLAISQKTSADHTCIVVAGRVDDGTIWVLAAERGHWTMPETLARVVAVAERWQARVVNVERVAYQAAAVDALQRMPELRGLTINGVVPKGDKLSRATPMSPRVASGAIRFASTLPQWFFDEVRGFPLAQHDDAVDAMQLAYEAVGEDAVGTWRAAIKGWLG